MNSPDQNVKIIEIILWIILVFGTFIAIRWFICWYFGINEIIKLLKQIRDNTKKN